MAQAANTVTITWNPPATMADQTAIVDPTALSYNLYAGLKGATKTLYTTTKTPSVTINTGLSVGATYCYQVTAYITSGVESALSNEACKSFLPPAPVVIQVK
jgi:fibronectin type 3 domain-containing protein